LSLTLPTFLRRSRSSWLYIAFSLVVFLALTMWLYGPEIFSNTHIVGGPGGDEAQEVWFLAWPVYALGHGHNPFISNWMNYPRGLNLLDNTSMPGLAILFSPITVIFGPVATFMILMRLGMILSAVSLQWVARRLGISRTGSFVAGLLYGFSIEQFNQGYGHLFLVFAPLPPLILYNLYLLVTKKSSPRQAGLIIGVLTAADFLISPERSLMTLFVAAIGLVVAAALFPREVSIERIRYVAKSIVWMIIPAVVILALPLYEMMGKDSVKGASHPWIQGYASDLQSFFIPGPNTWWAPFGRVAQTISSFSTVENGSYVGIPLLLVLLFIALRWWRVRAVRFGAIVTIIIAGVSLGTRLHVAGRTTSYFSPYKIIAALKYFDNVQPLRYFYFCWLLIGLLVGFGLDRGIAWWRGTGGSTQRQTLLRASVVLGISLVVLASIVPLKTENVQPTAVQPWLLSKEASQVMKPGSVTLMFPYPINLTTTALLDQAVTNFPYKIIGGEAIVGNKQGVNIGITALNPSDVSAAMIRALYGVNTGQIPGLAITTLPNFPKLTVKHVLDFRTFARIHNVSTIVVRYANGPQYKEIEPFLVGAFGHPHSRDQGTLLFWNHAQIEKAIAST